MPNDPVADAVAASHKVLDSANKFEHSAGGPMVHPQASKAPYSLVAKARGVVNRVTAPAAQSMADAKETGEAIKSKMENVHAAGLD